MHHNTNKIFLKFFWEGKGVELRGIIGKLGKIIISYGMKKLLKKEQWGVIAQLCLVEIQTLKSSLFRDLQKFLDNYSKVFETPKGFPPIFDHDHAIHLFQEVFLQTLGLTNILIPKRVKLNVWLQKC